MCCIRPSALRGPAFRHLDGEFALLNALSASVQTEEALLSPETALLMKKAAASSTLRADPCDLRSGITAEGRSVSLGTATIFFVR
jgi:hypothetical protein